MAALGKNTRWVIIAVAAAAALVGVGVITFFSGSDDTKKAASENVQVDMGTISGSSAKSEQVLFLPWGTGPKDASRKGSEAVRSTIEAVFSSGGRIFVVDHPEGVFGARVRWFSPDGQLVGTHTAWPGSTHFRPHPGGYNFVVAKSGGKSETAVVVDVDASTEVTYTIPLQLNSGGLVHRGDTLYATVNPSDVDQEQQRIYSRYALVPVAIGGKQVEDAAADAAALELWGWGMDGKPYTSRTEVKGLNASTGEVITLIGQGERSIRIPRQYRLLGVSADSRVYLNRMPPDPVISERPVQLSACWISAEEPYSEVLVTKMDGKIDSCIALPYSRVVARYDMTLPMWLSEDGLYSIRAAEGGVAVVVHRFE